MENLDKPKTDISLPSAEWKAPEVVSLSIVDTNQDFRPDDFRLFGS